jgi:putative transcriptional regulator
MKAPLAKGVFLIAAPSLRDPNFRQTVVLLCEHGAEGALGVVVNRPTAMSLKVNGTSSSREGRCKRIR